MPAHPHTRRDHRRAGFGIVGPMGDIHTYATARQIAAAIRSRQVSPVEVLDACLARIDAVNGQVNAVIWRNDEQAREASHE